MKKLKLSYICLSYICLSFLYACSQHIDNDKSIVYMDRSSFQDSIHLVGEEIDFDSVLFYSYDILKDSLILVSYIQANPFFFGLYNINSKKKITEFAIRGRGPKELLDPIYLSNIYNYSKPSSIIYIFDITRRSLSVYNLDSLIIKREGYLPCQINNIPDGVFNLHPIDSNAFICYNSYYLNSKNYNNNVKQVYKFNVNDRKPALTGWKYFTLNVSAGSVYVSPNEDRIVVTDRFSDRINIYRRNLSLIKTIIGPDMIIPEYRIRHENSISFKKGKRYEAYFPPYGCYSDNYLYLSYHGLNGIQNDIDETMIPSEVFKIDWDGRLIMRYILDKYIGRISVTSDEKYLYGTSYNRYGSNKLIRYTLKK